MSDVSDNTFLAAANELEAQHIQLPYSQSTSSQESYITPGQRPQDDFAALSAQTPIIPMSQETYDEINRQSQQAAEANLHQVNVQMATDFHESKRYTQCNSHQIGTDSVPAYGRLHIEGPALNIYARIIITQPGDPITKTLTNPHVAQSFRLHIPNNFATPYFRDRQFLTYITNTAKSILENSFPFPFFDMAHLKYIIEADSLYYNYMVNNNYFIQRININHLRAMDPALRDEWLVNNTPHPSPFLCTNGKYFDASYDIVLLIHNVRLKRIAVPQSPNEALLVMGINE